MTDTNTFLREVDEDVRREKIERLWQRYGRYAIAVLVALIIGTATLTWWRGKENIKFEAATTELATQLQTLKADNDVAVREALNKLAADAPAGQATLARLYVAGIADEKDRPAALAELKQLSEDEKTPRIYRELAKLLSIQLRLDTDDALALQNELSPLKAAKQPWRWSALEYSALLSIKQGDPASAQSIFEQLAKDADTPQGIRARAQQYVAAPAP